jgi:hypothetical protein
MILLGKRLVTILNINNNKDPNDQHYGTEDEDEEPQKAAEAAEIFNQLEIEAQIEAQALIDRSGYNSP